MTPPTPPLGLYIHIPFCARKCPYCDFHSVAEPGFNQDRFARAIAAEIAWRRARMKGDDRPLVSIYIGGGTPSLLEPAPLRLILSAARRAWDLNPACEITLEANPESTTPEKLAGYREAGANRLSIGVQSLDNQRLMLLGRPHDKKQALAAIKNAREAGFNNLSLDFIFATPGHTEAGWRRELDEALALAPEHLSCYALTIEPETPFFVQREAGSFTPMDEDAELALFTLTREVLAANGLPPYEISNFARPGRESRHNLNYWVFGDYVGVGPGAHGKLERDDHITRDENLGDPEAYISALSASQGAPCKETRLTVEEAAGELVMMGLRARRGVDLAEYARISGKELAEVHGDALRKYGDAGWLVRKGGFLRLTNKGLPLANEVMAAFL